MNVRSIKSQIKKAGFDISEWQVERSYKSYQVFLTSYGLTDSERQVMTGDQVNKKRKADEDKVKAMAELFNTTPEKSGIKIYTEN
jgi:hypothetical protein